jgi:hypothetical protein
MFLTAGRQPDIGTFLLRYDTMPTGPCAFATGFHDSYLLTLTRRELQKEGLPRLIPANGPRNQEKP